MNKTVWKLSKYGTQGHYKFLVLLWFSWSLYQSLSLYLSVYISFYLSIYLSIHLPIYLYNVSLYVFIYIYIYLHIYIYIIYIYIFTYIYITYIDIYIYIFTYIYILHMNKEVLFLKKYPCHYLRKSLHWMWISKAFIRILAVSVPWHWNSVNETIMLPSKNVSISFTKIMFSLRDVISSK